MGIAAYNRGSRAIREQIDQEQAAKERPAVDYTAYANAMDQIKALQAKVASLESDLTRAKRSIDSLRATSEIDRTSFREYHEHMEGERKHWMQRSFLMQRRWVFASGIVRTYVSPEQVEEYRQEHPGQEPKEQ